jgi:hypothetical protein
MRLLLRLAVIALAGFMIWEFSHAYLGDIEDLRRGAGGWLSILSAISETVLAPLLSIVAILLAAANRYLGYAAGFFFILPFAILVAGIMIYGF